jgi:hypothetical protein
MGCREQRLETAPTAGTARGVRADIPAALAAELDARGSWDEVPGLYLVSVREAACELRPLPGPGAHGWRTLGVHGVIAVATQGFAAFRDAGPADPALVAAAVRFEDWDLPWPLLGGTALPSAAAALLNGTIGDRPDRIRARFIIAAGRDGTSWLARQHRHSSRARVVTVPVGQVPPPVSPRAWSAITCFTRTVLGPPGPEPEP